MAELCSVCKTEVRGGFEVYNRTLRDGTPMVVVDTTPDRDYNICDLCNVVVHFRCSRFPETGYCDACCARLADVA